MCMVPVTDNTTLAAHHPVQTLREPHRGPFDRAHQRRLAFHFHQKMDVVTLHGELHQLYAKTVSTAQEGLLDHTEGAPAPEVVDLLRHAERHMHRHPSGKLGPCVMGDPRTAGDLWPPTGSFSLAAPRAEF